MTTLKNQITDALKTSMRAKDMATVTVLRSLQAAIKQIEVDERIELDDAQVLAVIEKQIKQRKESIKAFEGAGRDDLASKEQAEAEVLLRQGKYAQVQTLVQRFINKNAR
ncbi:GatB/YqeY domain-containing protein, partial [Acinetobacter baumannii]